uniref:Tubulin glycylase 3A n=1 Tax=Schizaphis graminum TaxID=13262 RepID=A0A2S2P7W8_SCHGA
MMYLGPTVILSLHNNVERVKTVVKRYESGLVWTDAHSSGVNWMTLHPDVVINRFPRDANAALKLCGHTLAGKPEFDFHYPRAYRACDDEFHADRSFVSDYSLTACVSLLRAFVDGDHQATCAKSGQAPLSALHFAATKCHKYLTGDGSLGASEFSGKGAGWETFFEHYYMIVHDKKKFTVPGTGDDVDAALRYLAASSRLIVNQMTAARPQTAMDGYKNIWIVKDTAGHRRRPVMLNKIGDVLNRCAQPAGDAKNRIVQKYIETPLLRNNVKSDVYTWIVLSTLGGRQTTWLHRKCVVQPYAHGFSLYLDSSGSGHFDRFKTGGLHGMLRSTALIFGLKQLGAKMRRGAKTNKLLQQQRRVNEDDRTDGDNVYTAVKQSVVSAVTAAVASSSINLRPNCLELFRGTFVLGDDLRPWLIDIVSDDPCLASDCEERDRLAAPAATRVMRSIVQGVAKMLVESGRRGRATRFGMFDMVHECPLPVGAGSYVPRLFVAPKSSVTKTQGVAKRTHRSRLSRVDHSNDYHQQYWWNDDNIHTYVEMISAEDVQDIPLQRAPCLSAGLLTAMADNADLFTGSAKNRDLCDPNENRRYLKFLNKYKTKITSAQRVYKSIIHRNCNNKKRST